LYSLAFVSNAAHAAVQYTVIDLGTIGGPTSFGGAINNYGEVTGDSSPTGSGLDHAFLWTPTSPNATTGTIHDLGGALSHGFGINAGGQVTGNTNDRAFRWTPTVLNGGTGTMNDVGTPSGMIAQGEGINDNGVVVGVYITDNGGHAFLQDSTTHDLETLGGASSVAYGINSISHVVGTSDTLANQSGQSFEHAFLYDSSMHDLGTLGGNLSTAAGINSSGQVVGSSQTSSNTILHAFLWTPNAPNGATGTMQDLGSLGGFSNGNSVNASGEVVGSYQPTGSNNTDAFVYTAGTGMIDLNTLIDPLSGWQLRNGGGVNDLGQITGWGVIGGNQHAFLLTPVPEPTTFALEALVGIAALTLRRSWFARTG
jgi:probable HAF family extracellular repeat protein